MEGGVPQVGDVHKGIVEGGEDKSDAEDEFAWDPSIWCQFESFMAPMHAYLIVVIELSKDICLTIADLRTELDVLSIAVGGLLLGCHDWNWEVESYQIERKKER